MIPLSEIRYVRPRDNQGGNVRSTISITSERNDIHWMFPSDAEDSQIDMLAELIENGTATQQEIENVEREEAKDKAASGEKH